MNESHQTKGAPCSQQRSVASSGRRLGEQRARDSGGGVTAAGGRGLWADTGGFFTDLYSIIGSKSNFTIIIFLLSGVVLLPRALYEVCECNCCVQHQLAPTLQNSPSVSVRAGRGGEGPPSLQRRGVSSLKQPKSSADTHRRSLRFYI